MALFFALRGYNFATNAHHDQVFPFIWKLVDPAAFPNDPYPATVAYYPSFFPQLVAGCLRFCPDLSRVMGCLYAVMIVGLASGIVALADGLFLGWPEKMLASMLILSSESLNAESFWGEDAILRSYADPNTLAWVLVIWALAFGVRRRWSWAFLLLGLAANLTPLPVLYVGSALAVAFCMTQLLSEPQARNEALKAGALCALAAAPILLHIARMPRQPPVDAHLWLESLKLWYPFHYFPESWTAGKWLMALSYTSLFGLLLARIPRDLRLKLGPLFLSSGGMLLIGFLARLLRSPYLIRLQFFRADALLVLTGLLMAAQIVGDRLRRDSTHALAGGMLLLGALTLWSCWPLAVVAALALVFEAPRQRLWRYGVWWSVFILAVWSLWRSARGEVSLVSPTPAKVLMLMAPLLAFPERRLSAPLRNGLMAVAAIPIFFYWLAIVRLQHGPEALPQKQELISVQGWCQRNTAPGSVFFVHPEAALGFRHYARRSTVFDWVDGAAMHWVPAFAQPWSERLHDFKVSVPAMREYWQRRGEMQHPVLWASGRGRASDSVSGFGEAFDSFTDAEVCRLLQKYPADFLITKAGAPAISFPLLLKGRYYRLHVRRIDGAIFQGCRKSYGPPQS